MSGFYLTYRDDIDPSWDYRTRSLYFEIVYRAQQYGDRTVFGRELKRGQLVISLRELEKLTGLSKSAIQRIISNMQNFGSLKVEQIRTSEKGAPKVNLITLRKWDNIRDNIRDNINPPQEIDNLALSTVSYISSGTRCEPKVGTRYGTDTLINNTNNNDDGGVTRAREDERQGDESEQRQIADELIHVLETDSQSAYQVGKREISIETARALAMDFASQCLMNNRPREHGRKLVLHFCYWYDKRKQQEQRKQAYDKRAQDNRAATAENVRRTTIVSNAIINGQLTLEQAFAIADAQCSLSSPPQSIPIDEGLRSTLHPPKLPEMGS